MKRYILSLFLIFFLQSSAQNSPGNVSSDIRLWLKADAGTNTTTNGGGITSWNDQSGNAFNATGTGDAVYDSSNTVNYNPVISFTGDTNPITGSIDRPKGVGSTVFVVGSVSQINTRKAIVEFGSSANSGRQMMFNNTYCLSMNYTLDTTGSNIWTIADEGAFLPSTIDQNGVQIASTSSKTTFGSDWTTGNYYLGDDRTSGDQLNGTISEVIYYDEQLSEFDTRKVESYLAVKYGLTLDSSAGNENGDYVLSNNTTLWDASANSSYHNTIIGIGRDDDSALNQVKSTDKENTLTLDKSGAFATDLDFMIAGADSNSFVLSSGNTPFGVISKSERIWKIETNGTPGTVSVSFEIGGGVTNTSTPSDYVLIIDNDTDFTSGATSHTTGATIVGNTLTFTDVSFSDGDYFTLGVTELTSTPGSVATGIVSWFKADSGTSTTVDGDPITQWNNNVSSTHATQAGSSEFPSYEDNIHNNNPSVYFTNGDNGYFDLDLSDIKDSDYNIIAVIERDNSNDNNFFIGTNSTSTNEALRLGYLDNATGQFQQQDTNVNIPSIDGFVSEVDEQPTLIRGTLDNGVEQTMSLLTKGAESLVTDVADTDFLTGTAGGFLGRGNINTRGFEGYVSEVLIYNSALSSNELIRIESYLAVKYALTLDNSGGGEDGDYLDGISNVIWDASENATYHNEIIAIGRDDNSILNQNKSVEPISSTALTIDKTENLPNNQDFIIVGNDNGTIGLTATGVPTGFNNRIERTWKAQVSGTPGEVQINITIGGAITNTGNPYDYALLLDTDTDFSDATIHTTGVEINGDVVTFTNVNLPDGAIFTLAVENNFNAPGDVIGNLALWLKADEGTNTTVNGGALTSWSDQSGNNANATGTGSAQFKETSFNNNPSIEFFNTAQPITGSMNRNSGVESTIFIVQKSSPLSSSDIDAFGDFSNSSENRQYFFENSYARTGNIFTVSENQTSILTVDDPGTSLSADVYENGLFLASNTKSTNSSWSGSGSYWLGDDYTGSNEFTGEMAEVLYYDRALSTSERQKVETYLAIKYGVSLDNSSGSTAGDYVLSDDSVLWDASTNVTYHYDIFAIGRDDNSILNQLKSRSENSDSFIEIEKSGSFSSDLDFISIGNNNASMLPTETDPHPSYSTRIERTWLVQTTGTPGDITLSFYLDDLNVSNSENVSDYALLIDTDEDFTSGATAHTTGASITDGVLTFTNVSLSSNQYITLAINNPIVPFPGAISNNLSLWLKADLGTNTTTDGQGITSWIDQSGNGASATGTGNAVYSNSTLINYNPTINFTNDSKPISGDISRVNGLGSTMFVIANIQDVTGRESIVEFDGGVLSGSDRQIFFTDSYSTNVTTGISKGISNLWTVEDTNGSSTVNIFENSNLVGSGSISSFNSVWTTGTYYLGDDATGGDELTGSISEVIYFDEIMSAADKQKVESYLAIKYGISLDNSGGGTAGDYVDSQNNTIWDASANSAYHNDVAMIGVDEESGLIQKQSKSEGVDGILTIALGNTIATSNLNNSVEFDDDLDFLAWGHNGTDDVVSLVDNGTASGTCPTVAKKLDRDWLIVNVGSVGTVSLSFDMSSLPDPNDYSLVIDDDGDFTSGVIETNTSGVLSGDQLVFSGITNLTNGVVFTLIKNTATAQIVYANGVWSGGSGTNEVPTTADSAKSIEVRNNVSLTENTDCECLTISSGVVLTVPTTNYLEVVSTLNLDGDIYLEGDAELVQTNSTNSNTGVGNIYKIIDDATSSEYRYNYLSSPVNTSGSITLANNLKLNTGVDLGDNTDPTFTSATEGSGTTISTRWVHTMNNTSSFLEIDENTSISTGVGFTMKGTGSANNYNFVGTPNNGNVSVAITSGNFLLTGNPYPSTINIDTFNANMSESNITDGAAYIWDQPIGDAHATGDEDDLGGYATIINGIKTSAASTSGNGANSGTTTPTEFIKPGQGFVVYGGTTGGNIQFTNALRDGITFDGDRKFFKTNKLKSLRQIIRLGFEYKKENGKTFHRQIATALEGGTMEREIGKDAFMFDYYTNDAFWVIPSDEDRYAITSVPFASDNLELPIGVVIENKKEVTFKLDDVKNFNNPIYLFDKESNQITDITNEAYKVTLDNGEYRNRFSLIFNDQANLSNDFIDNKTKTIIKTDKDEIEVVLEKGNITSVELYTLAGSRAFKHTVNKQTNSIKLSTGIDTNLFYVLKIKTNSNTITKKVFFK